MLYLIIPVVCFVLLAWIYWVLSTPEASEMTHTGKIQDLDLILSVLMTADWGEPHLRMKVPGHLKWVKLTFRGSIVGLELQLPSEIERSRSESYAAILRGLKLEPQISSDGGGHEVLACEIEGPPATAAALVKDALVRLFEVDPTRELEFQTLAHHWDQSVIASGLREKLSDGEVELPDAATRGRRHLLESSGEDRAGCVAGLAGFLILPVPFVIAHIEFGFIAASAVLAGIIVAREIYRRWKRSRLGFHLTDFLKITALTLAGATVYFNDPLYLQLVPTTVLSLVAVAELISAAFDLPQLSVCVPAKKEETPRLGGLLFSFSIIATSIGAAALNEYLRTNITLDAWIWFFAFFRVELVLGFLTTSIPLIFYMVRRDLTTERDSESP
jgi:intracellular septation protein A